MPRQVRKYPEHIGWAVVNIETNEVIGVYKDKIIAMQKSFTSDDYELQETVMNWDASGHDY